ncbi:MAG: fibronectin type III-like domain-contianing protein, partial [Desulfurococcaceae archaeon]
DTFSIEPAYELGYGLSYTLFEYSDLEVRCFNEKIVVELSVKNKGRYPGKEVVQVYVRALNSKLNRPFQELKGFNKTRLLMPGDEDRVSIEIPLEYLAIFNGTKWVVERGKYEIRVGSSSRDIRLKTIIEIPNEICYNVSWKPVVCN